MGHSENNEQEISPSDIIAMVNGHAIMRDEFEARVESLLSVYQADGGAEGDDTELFRAAKNEALDTMIGEALLQQGAELDGIVITEEEIVAGYEQVLEEFENDKAALSAAIEEAGSTEDDLLKSIAGRLKVQKYVEMCTSPDDMEVTDEDVEASYRNYTEGVLGAPSIEDLADGIREELERQRAQQAVLSIIEDLKKGSEIEVFIDL